MKPDLKLLRRKCPMPVLLQLLDMEQYAKPSCPSPFRPDQTASWGIFERNGFWLYKDFGTGECGDEISLLAHVYGRDSRRDFLELLDLYSQHAKAAKPVPTPTACNSSRNDEKPDTSFLTIGTDEQINQLSALRRISAHGLRYAQERGVLKLGVWQGREVYAVMDESGRLAELRRLDGKVFSGYGQFPAHKSHTVKHSQKNWPLGIMEAATCAGIALVEGMPDFLALHQFLVEENWAGRIAPVAMLTSSCGLATDALPLFKGKSVRIFPHQDQPGIDAAERWQHELKAAGARSVDFFNFQAIEIAAGSKPKDLCDFNQQRGLAGLNQQHILRNLIP